MHNLIDELKKLVTGSNAKGVVTKVEGGVAWVATKDGLNTAPCTANVHVGDVVSVVNGMVTRVHNTTKVYTFRSV